MFVNIYVILSIVFLSVKIFEIIFKIYIRNMLYKIFSYMLFIIFYIRYLIYKISVLHNK